MSKVSIIVPCYNVQDYVSFCLDTLINQDYKDIEILCINDGSTDNTPNILSHYEKFDARIKVIHQENGGLSSARNTGIEHAAGKYLCFVDSDDYVSLQFVERAIKTAEKYDADMVYFNYLTQNMNTRRVSASYIGLEDFEREDKLILKSELTDTDILKMGVISCNKLYKTEFIKSNDIRFIEGLRYEDNPWFAEVLGKAERFAFLEAPLYYYRLDRKGSLMNTVEAGYLDSVKALEIKDSILSRYGLYDRVKGIIMHMDISFMFLLYNKVKTQYKKDLYDMIKAYLQSIDFSKFSSYTNKYAKQYAFVKCILQTDYNDMMKGSPDA